MGYAQLERDNERLRREVAALQGENENMSRTVKALNVVGAGTVAGLLSSEDELDRLRAEVAAMQGVVEAAQRAIDEGLRERLWYLHDAIKAMAEARKGKA